MAMKNRKQLLEAARSQGFNGKTLEDFNEWREVEGYAFADPSDTKKTLSGEQLEKIWNTKTVYVTARADNGEPVEWVQPEAGQESAKAEGEDEDEAEAEMGKAVRRGLVKAATGMTAKNWQNIAKRKAYDKAAREGRAFRGAKCVYADADRAELATAAIRLAAFGRSTNPDIMEAYATQKRADLEIFTKGSIGDPAAYGSTVVEEYAPELIENLNTFGAARLAAGVTPMSRDSLQFHRWTSDVTITDTAEGAQLTETDGAVDRPGLYAKKTTALCRISNELLNDSAINIANQLNVSIARAVAEWEDKSYFLGTGRPVGLVQTAGADSDATYDAANTDWSGWTIAKLQAAKGKLPGWALDDPDLAIVCNPSFYESVLKVNAYSAGGTQGDQILNGTTVKGWDGVPVVFSNVMPRSFVQNQIVAYIGSFKRATKFGVVRGSEQMATSNDFYFDTDEVALRYTQRWDYVLHDVTGTNTGIVALKD
jgi:HK97 family phage major capsid protein